MEESVIYWNDSLLKEVEMLQYPSMKGTSHEDKIRGLLDKDMVSVFAKEENFVLNAESLGRSNQLGVNHHP